MCRACDPWPPGGEFKSHFGCEDYFKKKIMLNINKIGNRKTVMKPKVSFLGKKKWQAQTKNKRHKLSKAGMKD